MKKKCVVCDKLFTKNPNVSKKQWEKSKYCSIQCCNSEKVGSKPPKTAFKKGDKPWNKGNHVKLNNALDKWREAGGGTGEKNPRWKGEKAKYSAIHMWVKHHKGKPEICFKCGKKHDGKKGSVHWANIDHKYKRNLDDYIALCPTCHKRHDLDNCLVKH